MNRLIKFVGLFLLVFLLQTQLVFAQTQTSGLTPCSTGLSLSVGVVSSNTQLNTCGSSVIVWNIGTSEAFVNWGTLSTTTATATGWSVPAGTSVVLNTGRAGLYLAAITSSSTTTIRLIRGNGNAVIAGGSGGGGGVGSSVLVTDIQDGAGTTVMDTTNHAMKVVGIGVAQGSTTSGQTGSLVMGAITTDPPSYTTAQTNSVSLTTTGGLRVSSIPAISGGLSVYFVQPAASDNHVVIKAGAGQVYKVAVTNNSATVNYLRLYNATTGFNGCNSATNLVYQMAIPASTSVGGLSDSWAEGMAFSAGISICVTSGYATTDTTNATATAMSVNIGYK